MSELSQIAWPDSHEWPRVHFARVDNDGLVRLDIEVPEDTHWFSGHFPGQPVLAGIVQLHWAVNFARLIWPGLDSAMVIENLKFQKPVLPGARIELCLEHEPDRQLVRFRASEADQACSQGRVSFL